MEAQTPNAQPAAPQQAVAQPAVAFNSYLRSVFSWMIVGVAITGAVGYAIQGFIEDQLRSGSTLLVWGVFIAQIVVVVALSAGINKISPGVATLLFLGYSALVGVTCSMFIVIYGDAAIFGAFFASSAMFAALAGIGYTTKADLTSWGPFLFAGMIGVFVGGLIGMFFSMAIWNVVYIWGGLIVFMGLTIYLVNQMKRQQLEGMDDATAHKATIIGALMLYLAFINIFFRLAQILGGNR